MSFAARRECQFAENWLTRPIRICNSLFFESLAPNSQSMNSKTHERIFLSPPHMGGTEIDYVMQAFKSNYIAPTGPQLAQFERAFSELTGMEHCVAVASGTAAMHLVLRTLGVKAGDYVLASSLTFIGSVSPITFLEANPVFVDCDAKTWTIDPNLVADSIKQMKATGKLPAAVVPTDLYGQCSDVDALRAICDPEGIPVVVDSAEALGATYRGESAGKRGRAAIFSFNGNKIITTSGGGMLATDDEYIANRCKHLSTQAREPFLHYEHEEVGYNYRMSNVLAGIGLGQLEVLAERVNRKRYIFDRYVEELGSLPGVSFMPEAEYGRSTRWLTVALVDASKFGATPSEIIEALDAENIESRPVWKPMHMQPAFSGCAKAGGTICERFFREGICLPSGTMMTDEQQVRVCSIFRKMAK